MLTSSKLCYVGYCILHERNERNQKTLIVNNVLKDPVATYADTNILYSGNPMMKRQAEMALTPVLSSNFQTMNTNTNEKRDDQTNQMYKSVMPVSELLPAV